MRLIPSTLRSALAIAAALVLGYAAHSLQSGLHPVEAQSRGGSHADVHSDEPLAFQLSSGLGPASSLTVYNSAEHTLYVYQAVTQGNAHVNCSFALHLGRLGGPIERQNCPAGNAF